jgi:acyl-coenzyme A synthetase/AMP-(fatty) acid ligase
VLALTLKSGPARSWQLGVGTRFCSISAVSLLPLFDLSLIARADRSALECESAAGLRVAYTFGDLERRSNRLAHLLRARGLKSGDRLAFFLQNRIEVIDLWLAGRSLG